MVDSWIHIQRKYSDYLGPFFFFPIEAVIQLPSHYLQTPPIGPFTDPVMKVAEGHRLRIKAPVDVSSMKKTFGTVFLSSMSRAAPVCVDHSRFRLFPRLPDECKVEGMCSPLPFQHDGSQVWLCHEPPRSPRY